MGNSGSSWLVIVLGVLAANLPFLNERLFAVIALRRLSKSKTVDDASNLKDYLRELEPHGKAVTEVVRASDVVIPVTENAGSTITDSANIPAVKSMWWRLFELIILYFCVGVIGFALESSAGNRFPQAWQFFAINACLFLVLAFPGFVYRYLRRHHG